MPSTRAVITSLSSYNQFGRLRNDWAQCHPYRALRLRPHPSSLSNSTRDCWGSRHRRCGLGADISTFSRSALDPTYGQSSWSPRDGAALLVHNDRLWLFGGSAPSQILDVGDGWSSVDGIDWRKEIDRAPWTRSGQSMSVAFAGRLWRMGGFVKGEPVLPISEIWSSLDGRTWTLAVAAPAWKARGGGALVVHNGKLWLLGGTRHPENEGDQPPSTMSGQPKTVSTGWR